MTIRYINGVSFPSNHEDFKYDKSLKKKIRRLSDLVEIRHDFNVILETYDVLEDTISKKLVLDAFHPDYGIHVEDVSEMIFTHLLITYAKAFLSTTGATSLNNKINIIFPDIEVHEHFMTLRNQFYGHREMAGNAKMVRLWPNSPESGRIEIDVENLFTRWQVAKSESTRLSEFKECVLLVLRYLDIEINNLKTATESSFTEAQANYICNESRESIESTHGEVEFVFQPRKTRLKPNVDT